MSAVIDEINLEPAQRSRIWRSKEARGIRDALVHFEQRGVVSDFSAGKLRLGRMTFEVTGGTGRRYRLLLDVDAGTLKLEGMLPAVSERSPVFKELKNLLRSLATAQASLTLRVDPCKGEIQLLPDSAGLVLAVTVKGSEYEHCTRRLIALANEIRKIFFHDSNQAVERRSAGFGILTLT
ncbi:MAG TPA: hypothetical protein VGN07_05650 [Steroidobacteraceae bacterium]